MTRLPIVLREVEVPQPERSLRAMSRCRQRRVLLILAKPPVARALAARPDLDVKIFGAANQRQSFEAVGCGDALVPFPYVTGGKLNPSSIRSVRRAIRQLQPEVVHAFYPRPLAHTVLATLGMRHRPRIISFRGVTAPAPWWSGVQRITYQSKRVDAHACESSAVRDALIASGISLDRCRVVYNCPNNVASAADRLVARSGWGVPQDAFVVAMVANMRRVKGADLLVRAALDCADLKDVHWVMMGHVHDKRIEKLSANPRLAGKLHLVGYHPNASSLVSAADVFVMPSRAEALCVALLEAMEHGLCPVVSDAGGMKEVVRDGLDGLVFPREDWRALADCVRRLRADTELRVRLGASARSRVADEFSAEAVATRIAELY
jgi:glycosyltransferase involved in cell wall biosynthesis